ARVEDWKLIDAGIRVQVIKKTDGEAGIGHYGTEVITNFDHTLSALLGASPGASASVALVLEVVKLFLPHLLATSEGKARMKAMIPTYDEYTVLPESAHRFQGVRKWTDEILQ